MGQGDRTPRRRTAPLREIDESTRDDAAREATLTAAMLRIGASLDLDTVLREVVESARALTGAAYGVIATVDEAEGNGDRSPTWRTSRAGTGILDWRRP